MSNITPAKDLSHLDRLDKGDTIYLLQLLRRLVYNVIGLNAGEYIDAEIDYTFPEPITEEDPRDASS